MKLFPKEFASKTVISSKIAYWATLLFTLYNGYLGIRYHLIWNLSIAIYYLLLTLIRGFIIKAASDYHFHGKDHRKRSHRIAGIALLLLSLSLIIPIALIATGQKHETFGLIPAIAIAAYTTWKVSAATVYLFKARRRGDLIIKELRIIGFIDAILSLLTLQNILLAAMEVTMTVLPLISGICGFLLILSATLYNLFLKN